jgi:predicted Zn-dependent protease
MFQQLMHGRILRLAILLGLLGLLCYPAGRHLNAWRHYRAARYALDHDDLSAARSELERCLEVWSGHASVHVLAARATRRAGDYEAAREHLKECRRLAGADDAVELESALLRAQQGDTGPVEGYLLARVQQDDPESPSILEALAKATPRLTA